MELTQIVSIGSFVLGIPQGIIGAVQLFRWNKRRQSEATEAIREQSPTVQACILILIAFLMMFCGFWLWYHPVKPKIATVEKIVEKPIPCPITQQKTGSATARGHVAIAHSGNGDTTTVAPPQESPSKSPH
jgi:hypothetical protein